ncbi:class I SAM-dependent methyltransferase [Nocardia barduliensis]|uniref:class I SAM-dependent methyltransferase n=1 Tax=Nocardia barduliensis TaxID=2736643 RepID=UPI001573F0C9|nr:class I SAM-dependent methyltransferase [Nocardia barduliensis]
MTTDEALDIAGRAAAAVADFDARHCLSARDDLDLFGLRAMADALRPALSGGAARTEDEIAAALAVAPRHRWLLRRWLGLLAARGWLDHEDGRTFSSLRQVAAPNRAQLDRVCADLGFSPQLARFFAAANRHALDLLRDRVLAQELLFPDADLLTAEAAYRDNPVNRYLNAAAGAVVGRAVADLATDRHPVCILELGAGVGGTTADLLPVLDGLPVEYHFTDVSAFFLDAARARFSHYPWLRFDLLDLNADLPPRRSFDIILAANVLHNAQHCGATLARLRESLRPRGHLVVIESCREHCQLLTSMHFLMSPRPGGVRPGRDDVRAGTDRIFLTETQWRAELIAADLPARLVLPGPEQPLAAHGQRIFAARTHR